MKKKHYYIPRLLISGALLGIFASLIINVNIALAIVVGSAIGLLVGSMFRK